ncbi:MAG: hypothetical protein KBT03_06025 [Bacteroidales bacterium]|nr:hypothetical protein [Candidatus Scybalousia scybalohippi]
MAKKERKITNKKEAEKVYGNLNKYREPRIYEISDGVQIRYLNETQFQDEETALKIKAEKLKLINIFRNWR